jgi:hypothetical protein
VAKAVAVQVEMSQVADARRLVIETVKQFGRLDIPRQQCWAVYA